MKTYKSTAAHYDHGFPSLLHSNFVPTSDFIGWARSLASWFRLLELVTEQSGHQLMNCWSAQAWRCQPIPVVEFTRYPATKHLRPWGHVVRI